MANVKNRKPVVTLADRSLTTAKGKSLVAILAISLTTMMFTALFGVGGSLMLIGILNFINTMSHPLLPGSGSLP